MKRFTVIACLVILLLLVPPALASPIISGVSPSTGQNTGQITLTITGSGFDSVSVVRLNKCKLKTGGTSEAPFTGSYEILSSSKIRARFDLTGKAVGDYDVSVGDYSTIAGGDWGVGSGIFEIYKPSGSHNDDDDDPVTTEPTTEETTQEPESEGENSVFFETNPSGATIFLDGTEIGTSAFTYRTDWDGSHKVVVKKIGYEDYEDRVNIVEGQRTRFYALLTPLSSDTTPRGTPTGSVTPEKTTSRKKTTTKATPNGLPTPWGADPVPTEESPVNPATALWAVALGMILVVFRRW